MMENRPNGREKNVTGQGKDLYKHGEGLGTGPVGSADGHAGRTEGGGAGSGGGAKRASGGRSPLMTIILLAVLLLGGGGAGLSSLLGGGGTTSNNTSYNNTPGTSYTQPQQPSGSSGNSSSSGLGSLMSGSLSSMLGSYGNVSTGWSAGSNVGRLNTSVASGARAKRTNILGNGRDTVTIMVYMCGTDLESKYGMGTSDLQEMAAATLSDNVNIIVYTGGCKQWRNNVVSNSVNQIYKVENGGLRCLSGNAGNGAMTDPATLAEFIRYCAKNYPANRNDLIFWDHGGGSLSGYGYDEKNQRAGSMSLAGIDKALTNAGVTYDFIGFDACLMATLENALMLTKYADYLIASEETEPGVGWYYTNWLTELSKNTSMSTLEIGKNIVDDFVSVCAQKCRGQDTTLSVIDLAELETTVPDKFKDFAVDTSEMLQGSEYKEVSTARGHTREFASSSKIDQVDLVHLASNLGTTESKALADTLLSAVKYNKTSSTVSNAYGVSIYFPYQKTSKVSSAAQTYSAIGLDDEYTRCIQQFASMGAAGQAVSSSVSGYAGSPLNSLMGLASSSGSGSLAGGDLVSQMLMGVLSSTLTGGRSIDMDTESAAEYLTDNQFDSSQLVWVGSEPQIKLSEAQWSLINDLALSVFYDDGEGYIDLGLDNTFSFTDEGALKGEYDGTWLAIDSQIVPYYHLADVYDGDNYAITGYVPCLINDERAELLLEFDNEHPYGYVAGARSVYKDGETETIAKSIELAEGDRIDFVCDYYAYDGTYLDSYKLGETLIYHASLAANEQGTEISNVYLPDASKANAVYRFTDIYGQNYWTAPIA